MAEIRRMITETEGWLAAARRSASPPGHPRRFLEFEAFACRVRLEALRQALCAAERDAPDG